MKTTPFARTAVLAAMFGLAIVAQATTITVGSAGGIDSINGNLVTIGETVWYQNSPGLSSFTKVKNHYDATFGSGTSTYMNDDDSQELNILYLFEGTSTTYPFESAAGSWIYTSGKGDYANLTGAGTVTFNLNASDFSTISTLKGKLEAVPEPASMAILGVGVVGLIRRRKK